MSEKVPRHGPAAKSVLSRLKPLWVSVMVVGVFCLLYAVTALRDNVGT